MRRRGQEGNKEEEGAGRGRKGIRRRKGQGGDKKEEGAGRG